MTIPVWVEQENGTFTASVLGAPELRGEGQTSDQAVAALVAVLNDNQASGQLVLLDVPARATVSPGVRCGKCVQRSTGSETNKNDLSFQNDRF